MKKRAKIKFREFSLRENNREEVLETVSGLFQKVITENEVCLDDFLKTGVPINYDYELKRHMDIAEEIFKKEYNLKALGKLCRQAEKVKDEFTPSKEFYIQGHAKKGLDHIKELKVSIEEINLPKACYHCFEIAKCLHIVRTFAFNDHVQNWARKTKNETDERLRNKTPDKNELIVNYYNESKNNYIKNYRGATSGASKYALLETAEKFEMGESTIKKIMRKFKLKSESCPLWHFTPDAPSKTEKERNSDQRFLKKLSKRKVLVETAGSP